MNEKTKKNTESKTKADLKLHGGRTRFTVRIRPEVKDEFIKFVRATGISECHIIEAMITAYLTGIKEHVNWARQSPTIELTVVREVKRIRRYSKEYGPSDVQMETVGSSSKCAYGCAEPVVAMHFVYADANHCTETYVCEAHHRELRLRSAGYRKL